MELVSYKHVFSQANQFLYKILISIPWFSKLLVVRFVGKVPDADAEAGVCLALLVLANIVCQSDQPIIRKFA